MQSSFRGHWQAFFYHYPLVLEAASQDVLIQLLEEQEKGPSFMKYLLYAETLTLIKFKYKYVYIETRTLTESLRIVIQASLLFCLYIYFCGIIVHFF